MAGRIDWGAVRTRLTAAEAVLAQTELSEAQRQVIFDRRAEALAVPPPVEAAVDGLEVLVFRLGEERYAFPTDQAREVRVLSGLTPLPGAPAFVAGLINVRGRVLPVLDLRPLFGLRTAGAAAQSVILLSSPRGDVGILATDRPTVDWLQQDELAALPAGVPSGLDPGYVQGVTPDLIVVLDGGRLLGDQRLLVDEEI